MLTTIFAIKFGYPEYVATVVYHLFLMVSYITCVIGAIISDGVLGKYWTIVLLMPIKITGTLVFLLGTVYKHMYTYVRMRTFDMGYYLYGLMYLYLV